MNVFLLSLMSLCVEWKQNFVEEKAYMKEHPQCCIDNEVLESNSCIRIGYKVSRLWYTCMIVNNQKSKFELACEGAESSWIFNTFDGILRATE